MQAGKGGPEAEAPSEALAAERGAFRADQFELGGNARAHLQHTGPELLAQTRGAGLSIDAFVDFVGSGGTSAALDVKGGSLSVALGG